MLTALVAAAVAWCAPPASAADPVIAAAGDIACDPSDGAFNTGLGTALACHQRPVSDLLVGRGLRAVLPLGDLQYECGGLSAFTRSYDPSWGRLKSLTFPVPGNHEYAKTGGTGCDRTGKAAGYFSYFGAAAGDPSKGYYSYDVGAWHLIALNTNLNCGAVTCNATSEQVRWLKADLAAHPAACTLSYFHYPVFSSIEPIVHGRAFWQALYDAGADVVLGGHAHAYERFAPQTPAGGPDPSSGIRAFVVGTGGRFVETFPTTVAANSEVRARSFGVLELTLRPTGYEWAFVPDGTPGNTFAEMGMGGCHGAPGVADTIPPMVVLTAPVDGGTASGEIDVAATAVDVSGVGRVDFLVDGVVIDSDSTAPYRAHWDTTGLPAGLHAVSARAFDVAGNQTTVSAIVTAGSHGPVAVSPTGGTSTGDTTTDIYRAPVEGAASRRLTRAQAGGAYDAPAWSRNGRLIAFSGRACPTCPEGIFLIGPNGSGQRRLGGLVAGASRPDWGYRDRMLTFVGGSTDAVYTVDSRGRRQRRLTAGRAAHERSVWSPDGTRIAFTRRQRDGGWDLMVMRADGSHVRNLTRSRAPEVEPAWSHDGRRIAVARRVGGRWAVYVVPARGGRARRITSPALDCRQPAWSPNDRRLACATFTATGSSILVMRADGTRARRLQTGTSSAWAPAWSPSGRDIAFVSRG